VYQFAWLKAASLVLVDFWKVCSSFVVAKRFRAHLCCTETRRHSSECRETDLNSEVGGPEPKPRGNGIQRVGKLCLPQETDPHDRCNQHFDPKINGPPPLQLWLLTSTAFACQPTAETIVATCGDLPLTSRAGAHGPHNRPVRAGERPLAG